jgi:hypothetical protein
MISQAEEIPMRRHHVLSATLNFLTIAAFFLMIGAV